MVSYGGGGGGCTIHFAAFTKRSTLLLSGALLVTQTLNRWLLFISGKPVCFPCFVVVDPHLHIKCPLLIAAPSSGYSDAGDLCVSAAHNTDIVCQW